MLKVVTPNQAKTLKVSAWPDGAKTLKVPGRSETVPRPYVEETLVRRAPRARAYERCWTKKSSVDALNDALKSHFGGAGPGHPSTVY